MFRVEEKNTESNLLYLLNHATNLDDSDNILVINGTTHVLTGYKMTCKNFKR